MLLLISPGKAGFDPLLRRPLMAGRLFMRPRLPRIRFDRAASDRVAGQAIGHGARASAVSGRPVVADRKRCASLSSIPTSAACRKFSNLLTRSETIVFAREITSVQTTGENRSRTIQKHSSTCSRKRRLRGTNRKPLQGFS
jgi:hypothetical protein